MRAAIIPMMKITTAITMISVKSMYTNVAYPSLNKKCELMLMRPAKAYIAVPVCRLSWSISIVAIHPTAAENRKKSLKIFIFVVQVHSRSSTLTALKSRSPVLVMISSTCVLIYNPFYARQAIAKKQALFREYPSLTSSCANLVECRVRGLDC